MDDHNGPSATPRTIQNLKKLSKIKKIILIQGANLTYLGKREPEIYGHTTPDELNETLLDYAGRRSFELEISIQIWKARRSTEFTSVRTGALMGW
jgi:hypothetical protein